MFPPETMHTTFSSQRWWRAAASASAPAPSATTRARSASSRTAAAVSSSETANAPSSTSCARDHIAGSTAGEPEPSTNETWYSTGRGSPRSNAAVSGAPVSGSTA